MRYFCAVVCLSLFVSLASPAVRVALSQPRGAAALPAFVPAQVLVAFQPGTPAAVRTQAHQQAGGRLIRTVGALGVQLVAVPAGTVLATVAGYEQNPVEP